MASARKNSTSELDDENSQLEAPTKNHDSDEDTEDASETDMVKQEEEYTEIKEQVFQDQLASYRQQLEQLKKGKHPDYLRGCDKLQKEHEDRLLLSKIKRDLELEKTAREYEDEIKAIRAGYKTNSKKLKEDLVLNLEEQKRTIDVEICSMELTGDSPETKQPASTRKLRPRANDPLPAVDRRRKASPMRVNYLLEEDDVMEDLKNMNISTQGRTTGSRRHESSESISSENAGVSNEVKVLDGKLHYDRKWYCRGQSIYVEERENSSRVSAVISSINSSEIWIKKTSESSKLRITISQLQRGKYTISKRNN